MKKALYSIKKNDKLYYTLIGIVSVVVFVVVALLTRVHLDVNLGFDPHIFATINAVINSTVTVLLIAALWQVKKKNFVAHQKLMMLAMVLSTLFLVSYIAHHLFAGETKFGDVNLDNVVDDIEKANVGSLRTVYLLLLATHIPLAGIILPFILFTVYRGLTGEFKKHVKIAKITFPIWLFVSISGVVIYLMISPYYG